MSDSLKNITVRLDTNASHDLKVCNGCKWLRLHHEKGGNEIGGQPLFAFYCHNPKLGTEFLGKELVVNGRDDSNVLIVKIPPCDSLKSNRPPGWEAM